MWVRFLGWEDPLEEGMATHSSILAWKIPWTPREGSHTPRERQDNLHTFARSHLLCRRELLSLGGFKVVHLIFSLLLCMIKKYP